MNGKQLKNSILQWAIQGKLVPQDSNDEPASVLLEKIRQEKERLIKEKTIKRDKNASIIYRGEDNSYYEKILATGEVKCIDEEIPFEIPQGWEWTRLNSYSDVRDGTHDTPQYVVSGYPLITSKDFIGGLFDFSKTKYIDEQTFIEINKRSNVQIGDILFSMIGGNIGSMILITKENYFDMAIKNVALFKQYIYNDILIDYLYFYLQSQVVNIKNTASGGAQSFVSLNMLRYYLMPIPPLNEQKRIIEKFKSLNFMIHQYEKSYCELNNLEQELFPKLRKSILQEAIQGKLVPQIAKEGTAKELLAEIRKEKEYLVKEGKLKKSAINDSVIFRGDDNRYYEQVGKQCKDITEEIPFDLPDSWAWVRLGSISDIIGGYAFQSSSLKEEQGKRVIRISDISEQGFVNTKIVRYNGAPITDIYRIQKFDVIIAMTGGTVGKSLFVRELPEDELLLNQRVARIRNLWINVDYLYFVIIAPHIKEFINKQKNSTNDNISMADISNFLIPLPSIKEQQRIVAQIERLFEQLK